MYIILVYDICLEQKGAKRLSKVFKTCKKYLSHIQNSVFEGELTESQYIKMKIEINQVLNNNMDSIIIFKSRDHKWLDKEMLGIQDDKTSNFI